MVALQLLVIVYFATNNEAIENNHPQYTESDITTSVALSTESIVIEESVYCGSNFSSYTTQSKPTIYYSFNINIYSSNNGLSVSFDLCDSEYKSYLWLLNDDYNILYEYEYPDNDTCNIMTTILYNGEYVIGIGGCCNHQNPDNYGTFDVQIVCTQLSTTKMVSPSLSASVLSEDEIIDSLAVKLLLYIPFGIAICGCIVCVIYICYVGEELEDVKKNDDGAKPALAVQAFVVLVLSALSSLAYTLKWFDNFDRGIFMISMGTMAVLVRVLFLIIFAHGADEDTVMTRWVLTIATLSDSAFDIIQGIVLITGMNYDYEEDIYVRIGTWLHVSNAMMDFFKGTIEACVEHCEDILARIYWILIVIVIEVAHIFNIITMINDDVPQWLSILGIIVSSIILITSLWICVMALRGDLEPPRLTGRKDRIYSIEMN